MNIYADQINVSNWQVGDVLEDVRHGSPTQGCQFRIEDYDANNGTVSLEELEADEYVVAGRVFGRIK